MRNNITSMRILARDVRRALVVALGMGLAGCGGGPEDSAAAPAPTATAPAGGSAVAADVTASARSGPLLVALGDSLTAGLGLDVD